MTINNESELEGQALTLADIDRIHKTEGADAADAALQRIRLAREAREVEAPETKALSDLESLTHWLGDLEADAGKAPEVIEHLDELDADAEERAEAKFKARLATTLAEPATGEAKAIVAQESVLTSGSDVPKTANRAAQAVAPAENTERGAPADRALREHEAPSPESAPLNTNELTAAEDATITKAEIEHLLGDLEVGAGEAPASAEPSAVDPITAEPDTEVRSCIPGKGVLHHQPLAEHIAKWRAKHRADLENRRRLAAGERRSKMPSTRRNWRFSSDASIIEIPLWALEAAAAEIPKESEIRPSLSLAPGCFGLALTLAQRTACHAHFTSDARPQLQGPGLSCALNKPMTLSCSRSLLKDGPTTALETVGTRLNPAQN